MRYYHDLPLTEGEWRWRERFLWWPKRIGNETRWLESACWKEEVQRVFVSEREPLVTVRYYVLRWVAVQWSDL